MDTKLLKQKILDLAIRGKLVPQDPNDEPASVLLERIHAEREQLIKQGKLKRSKSTSDNQHYQNVPFEIPSSWEWATVKEIASSILYGVSESAKSTGKYKLLRITDIQENKVDWGTVPSTDFDDKKAQSYLLKDGDILFARTGATVGKSYLVSNLQEASIFASYLIRVQTNNAILPQYIKLFFESGYYWEQISTSSVGIGQPNVNGTSLGNLYIPIPPYNEQLKITHEVERWLALLTEIDSNKTDLKAAINIAKSKILDLAIHGKLVPQDPNDEPASELLKRIAPHATPCDTSHYENLPQGWAVTTMHNLCRLTEGEKQDGIAHLYLDVKYLRGKSDGETITSGKYVPANSTMILVDGENSGEIFTTPIDGYQGSTFKLLDISDDVYKPFILYVIRSYQKQFREHKVGSAIPHLNKKLFKEISVLIPPYEEQKRIVARIEDIFSSLQVISAEL